MKKISIDATNISFTCQKCGRCCSFFKVFLTEKDITKIGKLGYNKEEFVDYYDKRKVIKKTGKDCFFLRVDKERSGLCKIYKHRPTSCRMYPLDICPDKTVSVRIFLFLRNFECPGLGKGRIKSTQSFLKEMNLTENDLLEVWQVMPKEERDAKNRPNGRLVR
nr:YkgJ family cysteine cluster protein [Candidatus Njordarchaeota archaeon]